MLETLLCDERTAALATALAPAFKATPGLRLTNLWGGILMVRAAAAAAIASRLHLMPLPVHL